MGSSAILTNLIFNTVWPKLYKMIKLWYGPAAYGSRNNNAETWHYGTNRPEKRKECALSKGKNLASENVTCWWLVFPCNCPVQRPEPSVNTILQSAATLKPNATSVLKVMLKVFWTTEEVKCQRRGNKEIHSHSRRHQCLLQPQLNSFFYLWLLIEAGQIPPQNLLHSTVGIIFEDGPAGQNIKCSLYCSHITLISYPYNNINSSSISPVLKGSKFCAAARKGICQLKK